MRNLVTCIILGVAFIWGSIYASTVEASDYYVGTYKDGYKAYVVTGSVRNPDYDDYRCTIKAVKGGEFFFIDYHLWGVAHGWAYENSQGFGDRISRSKTPVAYNIFVYVLKYYGEWEKLDLLENVYAS